MGWEVDKANTRTNREKYKTINWTRMRNEAQTNLQVQDCEEKHDHIYKLDVWYELSPRDCLQRGFGKPTKRQEGKDEE